MISRYPGWAIVFIALLLNVVACTTLSGIGNDNRPPPSPLVTFTPEKNITTLWTAHIGQGADRAHIRFETVVKDGVIYTVDNRGTVTAVNGANGKTIWSANISASPSSGPSVQSGYLVFGTQNGEVIALDACDGRLIWRAVMSTHLAAPPRIANQLVLVKAVDGKLTALTLATGRPSWNFMHKTPLVSLQGDSAPVVSKGVVFVGFGDGQLFALALQTGRLLWQQIVALPKGLGDLDSMVDIIADPISSGSLLFVAAYQGKLMALSTHTGQIVWQRTVSTYRNFALEDSLIVVVDDQGVVWAINRFNGGVIWQQKALLNRDLTAPLIVQHEIWIGDSEGNFHVLSSRDGHFVARCLIDRSGLFAQPVRSGDTVLARSSAGELVKMSTQKEINCYAK